MLWYIKRKERHLLVTDALQRNPTPKGGASQLGGYLSARGARPGCNRAGIIFFSCGLSYQERQATQWLNCQMTSAEPISRWKSKRFHKLSSAPPPFLCIPANRFISLGGYHPCRGVHIGILPQFGRNYNQLWYNSNISFLLSTFRRLQASTWWFMIYP